MIAYEIWSLGDGDIFKGYDNTYITTFKSEQKATEYARKHGYIVEEVNNNYHKDYPFEDKE